MEGDIAGDMMETHSWKEVLFVKGGNVACGQHTGARVLLKDSGS